MTAHRLFRTAADVAAERQQRLDQPTEEHDTLAHHAAQSDADADVDEQTDDEPKTSRRRKTTS